MSDLLANAHFLRPWWLLALAPAALLWWLDRRGGDGLRGWQAVIAPDLLKVLVVGGGDRRRFGPGDLLLFGWVVGIIATAGPTWRQEPSPFAQGAPPAMVLLKVTPSMQNADLAPTRLDRARQKLSDLLGLRTGALTGLMAYAGSAHLVLPPTADASVVSTMAQALAPAIMPRQGDRLADALMQAGRLLREDGRGGAIAVFADTVAREQIGALEQLKANGETLPPITILALAPPDRADADPALAEAAKALGAEMVPLTLDDADVTALARRLARAPAASEDAGEGARWQEAGYWLTPLIALLALGWFRRGWVLA